MNRKQLMCALLSTAVLFTGCQKSPVETDDVKVDTVDQTLNSAETQKDKEDTSADTEAVVMAETIRIKILNATDAPNGVYYKEFEFRTGITRRNVETEIQDELFGYLLSYVETIPDTDVVATGDKGAYMPDDYKDHVYLGKVEMIHVTYGEDNKCIDYLETEKELFDAIPDDYESFISALNEFSDEDEQILIGEPMVMSPELYSAITGFTDDMVTDGTIEDYLKYYPTDVYSLMNDYATNYSSYYEYFKQPDAEAPDFLACWPAYRALPKEIRSVESTDEEYQKFVDDVKKSFNYDPNGKAPLPVTVYRSTDLPYGYVYEGYPLDLVDYRHIDGEYVFQDNYTFFYSRDGKFVVCLSGSFQYPYGAGALTLYEVTDIYMQCKDLLAEV